MKHIQLSIEEGKTQIVESISNISNSLNLDYYFLYGILKDIIREIEILKDKELEELKTKENSTSEEEK